MVLGKMDSHMQGKKRKETRLNHNPQNLSQNRLKT